MVKEIGAHCGCCTYLSVIDPVLHKIISDQGEKFANRDHCKCCAYWRAKGVHEDISKARKYSRPSKAAVPTVE